MNHQLLSHFVPGFKVSFDRFAEFQRRLGLIAGVLLLVAALVVALV